MRNHIHPVILYTIFVAGLGLLLLSMAGEFYYQQVYRYYEEGPITRWDSDALAAFYVFLSLGSFWLVGAIGLALRKNWARVLLQLGFIIVALAWLLLTITQFNDLWDAPFLYGGITAGILGIVIGSLLFLNNADIVLPFFGRGHEADRYAHVLDAQATRPLVSEKEEGQ